MHIRYAIRKNYGIIGPLRKIRLEYLKLCREIAKVI